MSRLTADDRFWNKVRQGHPWECWEWTASRTHSGYGSFKVNGVTVKPHRYIMGLENGDPIFALHRCDNPPCVNPAHLFLGTHEDNMADMRAKGRDTYSVTGEKANRAKITDSQCDEIRALYATGCYTYQQIGDSYGLGKSHVGNIIRGDSRCLP